MLCLDRIAMELFLASIITMISVFSGITLFSLGIIGEYLWRILENIKKTKWYTAKKIEKNNYYE